MQEECLFLHEGQLIKIPYKAVMQITEAVNEGNSITEIQHSINVGAISNPLIHTTDQALIDFASKIYAIRNLQEVNLIEETSSIKPNIDAGVAALVRAIEKTALECDEISSLITAYRFSPEHVQKEKGDMMIEAHSDMQVVIHDDDVMTDDVADVLSHEHTRAEVIKPLELSFENNVSKVRYIL